jgi:hypothetical protein
MNGYQLSSRRSFLTALVVSPALATIVAACGGREVTVSTAIPYPTAADAVILRVGYENGFVPRGYAFTNIPTLLISGDGRLIQPAPYVEGASQPFITPLLERTISPAGIEQILQLADAAKLLQTPPDYSAEINVTDVGDAVVVLTAKGGTYRHQAFALGMEQPPQPVTLARAALSKFIDLLADVEKVARAKNLGPVAPLKAEQYRIHAFQITEEELAGYQPAPEVLDWPAGAGAGLATASECTTVEASAVETLFTEARQQTLFRDAGVVYQVAAAAVLPGDRC